jgi:hypothetical protein
MKKYLLLICLTIAFAGCRKKEVPPATVVSGKITVNIDYVAGNRPLILDTVTFTNKTGNIYSVTTLHYYLSGFRFYKNNELQHYCSKIAYVDARIPGTSHFELTELSGMKVGTYDSVSFYIGIEPALNTTNSLPASLENIGMGWPDAMGGGYHFLKLEGHWNDGGTVSGYAMHLGTNNYQVKAGVACKVVVDKVANGQLNMTMNINEWYTNPYDYNFSTDGLFSMGVATLMQKLTENGADVFRGK